MKKIVLKITNIIILLAIFMIISCKKTDTNNSNSIKKTTELLNAEKLGQLHNSFLTHFKNEFEINPTITTVEDGIDYIFQFYTDYTISLKMDNVESEALIKSLNDYKRFLHMHQFYDELYTDKKDDTDSTGMYFTATKEAHTIGIIDNFEYQKLDLIGQAIIDNYNGIISNEELKTLIVEIDKEMKEYYGTNNSNDGQALAYTVTISLYSIEWWEENPDAFDDDLSKVLPAWVGADIAGAVYGAIVAGTGSYITNGSVNWGAVGISAGAGAISGSTGIIGKAGKWLSSLLQ